jgi:hypothetical protein
MPYGDGEDDAVPRDADGQRLSAGHEVTCLDRIDKIDRMNGMLFPSCQSCSSCPSD